MKRRIFKSKIGLVVLLPALAISAAAGANESGFSIGGKGSDQTSTWSEIYALLFGRGDKLDDIGGPVVIPDSIGGPVVIPDSIGGPVVIPDSIGGPVVIPD